MTIKHSIKICMRKTAACMFAVILAYLCCAPAALAASSKFVILENKDTGITKSELADMEADAKALSKSSGIGVYLLYTDYSDYSSDRDSAKAKWAEYEMGKGDDESGILLFIAVEDRRMVTITHGKGTNAFGDSRIDEMEDEEAAYLSDDDWLGAGQEYLALADETIAYYQENASAMPSTDGRATDFHNEAENGDEDNTLLYALVAGLIVGIVAAFVTRKLLRDQLKSVHSGDDAGLYTKGDFNLTESNEFFMGTTVKRVPKPKVESSGGGGSIGGGGFGGSGGRGF